MFEVDTESITDAMHLEHYISAGSRYFLILLNLIILTFSIGGNSAVLYGSLIHNALRMDKVTLLLVQNVAVADILISILFYLPALINLMYGRWALGAGLCFINGWVSLVPSVCEIITMTVLSCYRLTVVLGKLNRLSRSLTKPWFCSLAVLWGVIFLFPFIFSLLDFRPYYDPYTQSCNSADMSDIEQPVYKVTLIAVLNIFLNLIPMTIITTANVFILISIYKTSYSKAPKKNAVPMRTVKAIPLICLTFVFSYFPHAVACTSNLGVELPDWWRTVSFYFQALNTVSNPYIYMTVNLEFRRWVVELLSCIKIGSGRRNTVVYNRDISTPSSFKSTKSNATITNS